MNILLLQLKRIGDLILTIPAMVALRENFSDARITLVVSNECADLLPAISSADRILVAHRNLKDIAIAVALARERFDYCIDFTRNDRSAFLAFLSQARKRIVSHRVRDQSKIRARIYNHFVDNRMRDMKKRISFGAIQKSVHPSSFFTLVRRASRNSGIQRVGQKSSIMLAKIATSILF